jgi:hypothetical protein
MQIIIKLVSCFVLFILLFSCNTWLKYIILNYLALKKKIEDMFEILLNSTFIISVFIILYHFLKIINTGTTEFQSLNLKIIIKKFNLQDTVSLKV